MITLWFSLFNVVLHNIKSILWILYLGLCQHDQSAKLLTNVACMCFEFTNMITTNHHISKIFINSACDKVKSRVTELHWLFSPTGMQAIHHWLEESSIYEKYFEVRTQLA